MGKSPKTGRELEPETVGFSPDRRDYLFLLGSVGAAAAGGIGAMALSHDPADTLDAAIENVNDTAYFTAEAYTEELDDGSYAAVMELDPIDRDVVQDGEPAYNAIAEELDAEGNHLLGEDNTVLTNMQAFYDELGAFHAGREDAEPVSEYTVQVPGLEDTVEYTASAREMADLEAEPDSDVLTYEVRRGDYWRAFLEGLEPV